MASVPAAARRAEATRHRPEGEDVLASAPASRFMRWLTSPVWKRGCYRRSSKERIRSRADNACCMEKRCVRGMKAPAARPRDGHGGGAAAIPARGRSLVATVEQPNGPQRSFDGLPTPCNRRSGRCPARLAPAALLRDSRAFASCLDDRLSADGRNEPGAPGERQPIKTTQESLRHAA